MNRRILIVEDDERLRNTLGQLLSEQGYETSLAGNGEVGKRLAQELSPDIVITDVFMPEKDGIELIFDLRRAGSKAKVIAISGGHAAYDIARLSQMLNSMGVAAFLEKPLSLDDLLENIRKIN